MEVSFDIALQLNKHWSLGLERRDHNELPDDKLWENPAVDKMRVKANLNDDQYRQLAAYP